MFKKKESLDDVLERFQKEAENAESSHRSYWKGTEEDDIYQVDIHIWRKPGMGNSLQTIYGNKLSIMVATASYLENLVRKDLLTLNELDGMIEAVKLQLKDSDEK